MSAMEKSLMTFGRKKLLGPSTELGRFVDSLLQTFEDCRPGLSDQTVKDGEEATQRYFLELYEREAARLDDTIRQQEPHLSDDARNALKSEVDSLIRKVIVPAFSRLAWRFTPRERNDFYLTEEKFHAAERVGFAAAGILVGTFVILAPFIPLWEREWILPFMFAGLFFPNIRRYLAMRRYENELNKLVVRADREFGRIDIAYLTSGETIDELKELENAGDIEDPEIVRRLAKLSAKREKEH